MSPAGPPWLGQAFSATVSGLPASGFALVLTGAMPAAVGLASVLPAADPGCTVALLPDSMSGQLLFGGSLPTGFQVPSSSSLIGASLRHQAIALELDALGTIVGATASNALELTIGSF